MSIVASNIAEVIKNAIDILQNKYCRLLLLTGDSPDKYFFSNQCISGIDCENINLGKALSHALLDLPMKQRPTATSNFIYGFMDNSKPIYFSDIEILFDKNLQVDPIAIFKYVARNRLVVINWPGRYNFQNNTLFYANRESLEYYEHQLDNEILCFDEKGGTSFESNLCGGTV